MLMRCDSLQYQDLYNIPQAAFEQALREDEIESEEELEMEKEMELEGDGPEFVAADTDSDEYVILNIYIYSLRSHGGVFTWLRKAKPV